MNSTTKSSSVNLLQTFGIGAILLCATLLGWYIYQIPPDLDRSTLGLRGFSIAAKKINGLPIEFFSGQNKLDAEGYGLRILPLYDPDISNWKKEVVENKLLGKERLRRISKSVFNRKINSIPTLVVLPKWRDSVIKTNRLHPDLLIRKRSLKIPYSGNVPIGGREIRRDVKELATERLAIQTIGSEIKITGTAKTSLYIPQTISDHSLENPQCKSLVTLDGATLIAECTNQSKFWLLTDPDLINNHGVGNGDNYQIAVELITSLAKGKPIIVDGTSRVFITQPSRVKERGRSFADLGRFFVYPFTLIWIVLIGLCVLTLWHAWRRIGPIIDNADDETIRASKASAIEANVAILRGVDRQGRQDVPLAWAYVAQQMEILVADLFGASGKFGASGEKLFFSALQRRNQELARQLESVRDKLSPTGPTISKRNLFENLKQFEILTKEARHEFGRPTNSR